MAAKSWDILVKPGQYCWMATRTPKANHHVDVAETLKLMGYLPYQLVSLPDFGTINSIVA